LNTAKHTIFAKFLVDRQDSNKMLVFRLVS
jgi:hypothetical protein